ncbi:bifunctional 3-deoxy-7-phosphoheptulonate synthase/chorismate mutase [Pseudobacteriovorax antillogorgiicola]|uniref:chorismate mutase n=1 Tax=Pseudobacteriovorax antillogorgiicola TaxID=1513793 RepID=A0A1Y6BLP2_9BACT|nr:bifunctional 3-deoxy-7-phosphoheptulonate synthase/chorismate mutase [Pseudobacteriovorax antillogorgiicola]TCS54653.1 3-deoxy-D-arabinoheptulosonate-7-phosphate synthase [Pseudobacteriovorax antillogorgiicola]SMF16871.1 3-deoxy-D-arabinoheptulosonate-7-phosphate synthase [Pseudobacteriovorax antillogorgiicola]
MSSSHQISAIRQQLDHIDHDLTKQLIARFQSIQSILHAKQGLDWPARDHGREAQILQGIQALAEQENVDPSPIVRLFKTIMQESVKLQKKARGHAPSPQTLPPSLSEALEKKSYKLASRLNHIEDSLVSVNEVVIGGDHRTVIAGPCAVESEGQIMECAAQAKQQGAHILRGGCFKPRSSPYSFQGMGVEGLKLLENAGKEYGLPVVTEVMAIDQVEVVAKHSDLLQVGARNMQNFDLLRALGKAGKPVVLKRGLMATIDEWLSSAEYVMAHGNRDVILCERGIRSFDQSTRNTLDISAVPVVKERSHLPVIVDPSHAAGKWQYILDLSRASFAVGAHGIMIEIHPKPEEALSDGPQSLKFDRFEALMLAVSPWL